MILYLFLYIFVFLLFLVLVFLCVFLLFALSSFVGFLFYLKGDAVGLGVIKGGGYGPQRGTA